jgi:ribosome-binding ATPase YchF (GTP1/OBG family)
MGKSFLSHIREVDALVHVVRCFEDGNVIHVEGSVDPVRDIDTIRTELLLADIETTQKRADRLRKLLKNGEKSAQAELEAAEALLAHMDAGSAARTCPLTKEQRAAVRGWFLLTDKPVVYGHINEDAWPASTRAADVDRCAPWPRRRVRRCW